MFMLINQNALNTLVLKFEGYNFTSRLIFTKKDNVTKNTTKKIPDFDYNGMIS